jgi:hypothetical protein
MPGIPVGIMYCRGGFFTTTFETPEDERSVWFINLLPMKIKNCNTVPTVAHIPSGRVEPPGNFHWMRWGSIWIFQTVDNQGVMIRIIDRNPKPPVSEPPIHYHKGNPILRLTSHTDVPNLFSRLNTLTI